MNRIGLSLQHLLWYADEGEETSTLNGTVTGDKSWVHHYQPELKHASVQWKHLSSPSTKKFSYAISWEGYAYHVLGFSGSTVSPFSEA
jgi:hypothetical protein